MREPPVAELPGAAYQPRPFYFCDGNSCGADRQYCGPHALRPEADRTVVPVVGVVYTNPQPVALAAGGNVAAPEAEAEAEVAASRARNVFAAVQGGPGSFRWGACETWGK
ncbi:unnamed protein product, partial [Phaeothamnion confervicola]